MTENNPERQNEKKQRIRYSEEYRMNAARMVLIDGFSVEKAATSLGCGRESIRKWIKRYRARIIPKPQMTVEEENRLLKRENSRLQMELDFLKKAAAYFAKESK